MLFRSEPTTQVEGLDAVESLRPVGSCAGGADRTKLHVLAISEADLTCAVGASVSPGNEAPENRRRRADVQSLARSRGGRLREKAETLKDRNF